MNAVFADTSFYLALLSADDVHHGRAIELSQQRRETVMLTDWILVEVANALCSSRTRKWFPLLLEHLRADPRVVVVPSSPALLRSGSDLYGSRPDKDWSLTDCISFIVMQENGIREALTADRHFEQAGFVALLLRS